MDKGKSHFVLVHGACHGAWCWYKVVTLLKSAGHKVTALDLAASGVHPKQVHELRSIADYSEPLMEFMASLPPKEKVILVGHSLGGIIISIAMEKYPEKVSVAVFAPATMPGPHLSYMSLREEFDKRSGSFMDTQFTFGNGPDKTPTSLLSGPNYMSSKLYQLSPPEDLTLAIMLVRPVGLYDDAASIEETVLTREKYGSVRRVYIVCNKDKLTDEDFQRWMIENNPPDEDLKLALTLTGHNGVHKDEEYSIKGTAVTRRNVIGNNPPEPDEVKLILDSDTSFLNRNSRALALKKLEKYT